MANVETGQEGESSMSPNGAPGLVVPPATSHGTDLNGNATIGEGTTDALPDTMESRNESINRPLHQVAVNTSEDEPDPRRQVRYKLTPFQLYVGHQLPVKDLTCSYPADDNN